MKTDFIDLAVTPGSGGRDDSQFAWYCTWSNHVKNCTVLDVGTGICKIKERSKDYGWIVTTQEPCKECEADTHDDVSIIPSKSFDCVMCYDVIEHVKDYGSFAFHLARIARRWVIVTTPGFGVTTNSNPCHWHEFYPDELCQLLEATGMRYEAGYANDWKDGVCGNGYTRTREDMRMRTDLHPVGVMFGHKFW